ncbi:hypothetical protein RFI_20242 [Reticulomyxa filosa]|uniref:Uncharacterized protein n=1 Tax=Reticulomyxa filosa TaxID=46433 RepID=X6MVF3_RETFI|nr:hypothetical protein RFI_20242 [Reticulomyxa filosa]|eukprot:ETO17085.1 hypothetical protein RFI_20242 [Reticulomyxa filosa]
MIGIGAFGSTAKVCICLIVKFVFFIFLFLFKMIGEFGGKENEGKNRLEKGMGKEKRVENVVGKFFLRKMKKNKKMNNKNLKKNEKKMLKNIVMIKKMKKKSKKKEQKKEKNGDCSIENLENVRIATRTNIKLMNISGQSRGCNESVGEVCEPTNKKDFIVVEIRANFMSNQQSRSVDRSISNLACTCAYSQLWIYCRDCTNE